MGDCPNVEMRELLPERAAELLSPAGAKRVDEHVAGCEMCAFEMSVLRAARSSLQRVPAVDVRRVSRAVASATLATATVRRPARTRMWGSWRAAASIALVAVGATSVAVWRAQNPTAYDGVTTVSRPAVSSGGAVGPRPSAVAPSGVTAARPAVVAAGLAVAGSLSDLTDSELESLLGDIGSLDAASVAEPEDMIPAIGNWEGVQ